MKVFFASLGCDKNKVDSEKILKFFMKKKNFTVVDDPTISDIAIVNTCSFIEDAKSESETFIKYLVSLKKENKIKKIMVLGCLATEYYKSGIIKKEMKNIMSYVDVILPLDKYLNSLNRLNDRVMDILSFSSFIKISDGCDKYCSYCIIPYLRGRYRSNTVKNILAEAEMMAEAGVKEISIVGQDVLNYGIDLPMYKNTKNKNEKPIVDLINKMSEIKGIEWIRLLYCYPESIDESVIKLLRDNNKVLPYVDMPIQHISDKILKSMNRKTTSASIRGVIYKLRAMVPNIVIRTTLMVGFPGETEADFKMLLEFVKEMKFDKLGVFCYSREKLSRSYNFRNQVDDNTKLKRQKILLDTQKKIVREKNENYIGYIYSSIVEGYDNNKKKYVVRPYFNTREIDDNVYVETKKELISGTFVNVEIIKVDGMDLIAKLV